MQFEPHCWQQESRPLLVENKDPTLCGGCEQSLGQHGWKKNVYHRRSGRNSRTTRNSAMITFYRMMHISKPVPQWEQVFLVSE